MVESVGVDSTVLIGALGHTEDIVNHCVPTTPLFVKYRFIRQNPTVVSVAKESVM